ncbi:MAG: 23S rRNA (guanosine(2251)-2'-O)-methyltransferase RlmB [Chloroflexota bacterium]
MKNEAYIYGKNSIAEALSEEGRLAKIFVAFGAQGGASATIISKARKLKIPISVYDNRKFAELEKRELPPGAKSQGLIALKNLIEPVSLDELIRIAFKKEKNPILVALDEIADPHNLGAIARSAEGCGVAGLVLPERNSAPVTPAAIKVSAGALEHLPVAHIGNLAQALSKLKEAGFWTVGTDGSARDFYTAPIYDKPIVLIIGSEGKGIRPGIAKQCDHLVKIPMRGKVTSLNASVSAGVVLFEILRQKGL